MINPTPQMRADMQAICQWYEAALGWGPTDTAKLRSEYQDALQTAPDGIIQGVIAQSAAIARRAMSINRPRE